ncbi:MAG: abortive infection family protein [Candidatus Omnitrophota bacterium]|nr:abortive infection family protein [Candidatus Omnitrophota bacterium]
MSNLSNIEKRKLEKILGMESGYVLNFSNRTFAEFVSDSTGKDIDDVKYSNASCSKANRLRAFWQKEPNHVVAKLLEHMCEYWKSLSYVTVDNQLYLDCVRIIDRLKQGGSVPEIEAISPNSEEKDFETLAKSVRDAIDKNEPEAGIDRLHTFVVKYIRVLCKEKGIDVSRDKPLHSFFGEYVKRLQKDGLVESEMTERILKSSISMMEAFNHVRNNQSLAHDNPVLNYNESLLIFNHVTSTIRFLATLTNKKTEVANYEFINS